MLFILQASSAAMAVISFEILAATALGGLRPRQVLMMALDRQAQLRALPREVLEFVAVPVDLGDDVHRSEQVLFELAAFS